MTKFLSIFSILLGGPAAFAITLGQTDTFPGVDTQDWFGGAAPTFVASGGPDGSGFLRLTSSGTFGTGSHMATHNSNQWTGDYTAAGVRAIECDIRNLGSTELKMRVVVWSGLGTKWTSTIPVTLPPNSGWQRVRFSVLPADLSLNAGAETAAQTLADAQRLMFRNATETTGGGSPVAAILGLDNTTASAGRTISGQVDLTGLAANSGLRTVTFRFYTPGTDTLIYTSTGTVNIASDAFTAFAPPVPGTYDLFVKGSTFLAKKTQVNTTSGNVNNVSVILTNGDCDGDNVITTDDYLILSNSFDKSAEDAGFDARADLDQDTVVSTDDYLILNTNFDLSGDEPSAGQ